MIIYDHLPVLVRLFQYKGTVLQDTVVHVILVNLVVLVVLLFSHGGWLARQDRPEWMPSPFFSAEVSPIAWQMLILPLGFLLGVRSNQAYDRWSLGVDSYTKCINAGSELCRQACSYVRVDIEDGSGKPNWQYHNPPSGTLPPSGENDWEDPDKERLFRHVAAFLALVRQDIRKRRLGSSNDREDTIKRATEDRLHVTEAELEHLVDEGAYSQDVNAPLVVARWLSHDVAALVHRISVPTLIAAMEANVGAMVEAFTEIDKISDHPVPWPYTHLTQFFLVAWVYTLPLAMAPLYQGGTFFLMSGMAIILFGLDAVAREIQDPFGFDDNDLNVQGYEVSLFHNAQASIDGPLRVRTRDFASSTTHLRTSDGSTILKDHVSGAAELMTVTELEAGFEAKENLTSLTSLPWVAHGVFEDRIHSKNARKLNRAENRLKFQEQKTAALRSQRAQESKRNLSVFDNDLSTTDVEDSK